MAKDLALSIVIGAALSGGFSSVLKKSTTQLTTLGSTITNVEGKSKQIDGYKKLKGELVTTDKALRDARDRVYKLSTAMRNNGRPTKQMQAQLGSAKRAAEQLNTKLDSQRSQLVKHRRAMLESGIATSKLEDQEQRLGKTVTHLKRRYAELGSAIKKKDAQLAKRSELRGQMMDMVGLGLAIAAPIKAAVAFESTMADVKKVVDFESPAQFRQMEKDLLKMSTVIPMSASGLGDIVAAAGQAGIAREELKQFAEDAAKMGVAFDMSGKDAGSAMTGLRSIFKLNQDQVVLLGDAYNHLSNNMDAHARDLLNIANRAGSTANMFGLTGDQLGALSATFLALKTPTDVASTGINALLNKLNTATKQGDKFQTALANIGYSAEDMKSAIADDAQGALLEFLQAIKDSDDVSGNLMDLFGMEYADDITKLVDNLDLYGKALDNIGDKTAYAGSMQEEYAVRSQTTEKALVLFRGQINHLGVTIGSVLLPALNDILTNVGGVVGGITDLAERFPTATKVVVGLTMGLVAFKIAAVAGGYAMTFVKGAWFSAVAAGKVLQAGLALSTIKLNAFNMASLVTLGRTRALAIGGSIKAFAGTLVTVAGKAIPMAITAIRALGVAFMANPVGLIIGGIALAAGFLIANWEPVKTFFGDLWSNISGSAGVALDWIIGKFKAVTGWIGDAWSTVSGWFGGDSNAATSAPMPDIEPFEMPKKSPIKEVALAATMVATPVAAMDADTQYMQHQMQPQVHNTYHIQIIQQPGEDQEALAQRIIEIQEDRAAVAQRGALYDE